MVSRSVGNYNWYHRWQTSQSKILILLPIRIRFANNPNCLGSTEIGLYRTETAFSMFYRGEPPFYGIENAVSPRYNPISMDPKQFGLFANLILMATQNEIFGLRCLSISVPIIITQVVVQEGRINFRGVVSGFCRDSFGGCYTNSEIKLEVGVL